MTEEVISVLGICLLSAVLATALRKNGPEWAILLSLAVIVAVGAVLSRTLGEIFDLLHELMSAVSLAPNLFKPVVKIAGIAIVSRIGSELCKDAGEGALSATNNGIAWTSAADALSSKVTDSNNAHWTTASVSNGYDLRSETANICILTLDGLHSAVHIILLLLMKQSIPLA